VVNPTATQKRRDVQDTPQNSANGALGVRVIDQVFPCHDSMRGCTGLPVRSAATQNEADGQDTSLSSALPLMAGFGVIFQVSVPALDRH
jgi:hypothetical protein